MSRTGVLFSPCLERGSGFTILHRVSYPYAWLISGLDSAFLAASGLDSVLLAASGLDSGLSGGFWRGFWLSGGFWAGFWALGGVLVSRNGVVFSVSLERENGFMILHSIA